MLTLQNLIDEVRDHLAGRTDVTDPQIVRALNLGQEYIARSHDFEEFMRLETGVLTVSDKFLEFTELSASSQNPREIYSFRVITGDGRSRKLVWRTTRSFDRIVPEPEFFADGLPSIYTVWNDKFELWRVPDEAYNFELRMSVWPTDFSVSSPSATSELKEKDDLIIFLAVSWLYGRLGEYDRMGRFFNMYRVRANEAIVEDERTPDKEIVADRGKARPDTVIGRPWIDPFVKMIR